MYSTKNGGAKQSNRIGDDGQQMSSMHKYLCVDVCGFGPAANGVFLTFFSSSSSFVIDIFNISSIKLQKDNTTGEWNRCAGCSI